MTPLVLMITGVVVVMLAVGVLFVDRDSRPAFTASMLGLALIFTGAIWAFPLAFALVFGGLAAAAVLVFAGVGAARLMRR
jgi:hypothetical protein